MTSLFKPLSNPPLEVNIRMKPGPGELQSRRSRIEENVGAIHHLMLSAGPESNLASVEFCMENASREDLDVWITQVSSDTADIAE